jgi:hypothetical protein
MYNICRHFGLQLNIFEHATLHYREAAEKVDARYFGLPRVRARHRFEGLRSG